MSDPTPKDYAELFRDDRRGAAILKHLERMFTHPAVVKGGVDAVLQTYYREGMRQVIFFINAQIDRADGVDVNQEGE